MASKIFLDANILLDLMLKRENYEDAAFIINLIEHNSVRAYVTPSIIHILGHYLSRYYGAEKAKEIILTLLINIKIIDARHDIVISALSSGINDIEDALQYFTAIGHKVEYFISLDKTLKKSSIPTLPVLTPKEFINIFSN